MYVSMLFYLYQLTSRSEEHAWPGLQPLFCRLPQEWYLRQSLCSCPGKAAG